MKRIVILLPLVAGLAMPLAAFSTPAAPVAAACEVSELPWSTVDAVLRKVAAVRPYSYSQLVDWYQVGLVTVEPIGSGYEVRIYDEDGAQDIILIDGI